MRDLADAVGRDKSVVSLDLKLLAGHDLVELEERGRRKVPSVKHENVVVAPV